MHAIMHSHVVRDPLDIVKISTFQQYMTLSALLRSLQRFTLVKVFFQILTIICCSSVYKGMWSTRYYQGHNLIMVWDPLDIIKISPF